MLRQYGIHMAHEISKVKGFTYEATDPYVNMVPTKSAATDACWATSAAWTPMTKVAQPWSCSAGFFRTRHAAAQAMLAADQAARAAQVQS